MTEKYKNSLGSRIKAFRENLGVTQAELASKYGRHVTSWAAYESGRADPPLEILRAIANDYNIDLNELISGRAIAGLDSRLRGNDGRISGHAEAVNSEREPEYRLKWSHIPYGDDPFRIIDTAGLGERIRRLAGDNREEFAVKAGVDIDDLNAYIKGEDTPGRDHIRLIAAAGDVDPAWVARGAERVKVRPTDVGSTNKETGRDACRTELEAVLQDRDFRAVHRPSPDEIDLIQQMRFPGVEIDKQFISDVLVAVRKLEDRK